MEAQATIFGQYQDRNVLGSYEWWSYAEVDAMVEQLSRALQRNNLGKCDADEKLIAIFSETRLEWLVTELAACSDSIVLVPISVQRELLHEERICFIIE